MRKLDESEVRIFSGKSHPALAQEISAYLSIPLEPTTFRRFSNDNIYIQLGASVRGRVVFIIQSLIPPVSENLLEMLMMLDIANGAGAKEIHAIIPYFSYARSDKKDAPRISITARLIADLLKTSGATHVMTMTLHSPQVHGFFSVPTDPLTARPLFTHFFREKQFDKNETIVVAPDMGRAKSAARFAASLGISVAAADKRRVSDTKVVFSDSIERQVEGYRYAVVYDDEIATGGTIIELCSILENKGIQGISVVCTHGLFIGESLKAISALPVVREIVTTDTIPIPPEKRTEKLTTISVAPVFGEAIWRNYSRQSIGDLYQFFEEGG